MVGPMARFIEAPANASPVAARPPGDQRVGWSPSFRVSHGTRFCPPFGADFCPLGDWPRRKARHQCWFETIVPLLTTRAITAVHLGEQFALRRSPPSLP